MLPGVSPAARPMRRAYLMVLLMHALWLLILRSLQGLASREPLADLLHGEVDEAAEARSFILQIASGLPISQTCQFLKQIEAAAFREAVEALCWFTPVAARGKPFPHVYNQKLLQKLIGTSFREPPRVTACRFPEFVTALVYGGACTWLSLYTRVCRFCCRLSSSAQIAAVRLGRELEGVKNCKDVLVGHGDPT